MNTDDQSYEDFMAALKAKADAVKADIKAGRYTGGILNKKKSAKPSLMFAHDAAIADAMIKKMRDMESTHDYFVLDSIPDYKDWAGIMRTKLMDFSTLERIYGIPAERMFGGRGSGKIAHYHELYGGRGVGESRSMKSGRYTYGRTFDSVIIDELATISPPHLKYYLADHWGPEPIGETGWEKPEPDWKRTKFVSGGGTTPSEATRKKLRAKRKKGKR